jgi:ABC-type oligopeptide transport system substrate-binding subunit
MGAQRATELFSRGELDLVTGGRLVDLPYADTGPLARGNLRLDPAMGLFGLDVRAGDGFLAEPANREAIAAAIDRETLLEPFGIGGWTPTTRIVPANLAGFGTAGSERWEGVPLDTRRAAARSVVARWEADNGEPVELAIALPDGPGSDLLFRKLAQDLAAVGIAATRAQDEGEADLVLRDRVARYLQPRWFLNQFRCSVARRQCEEEADALLEQALDMRDATSRAALLAAAEETLLAANRFIPLGAPVRWSLARSDLGGFIENSLSVHPLFALSTAPI